MHGDADAAVVSRQAPTITSRSRSRPVNGARSAVVTSRLPSRSPLTT
jgi:hypothetical protein